MELPEIKMLQDFEDPVAFCFYLMGYTDGTRGHLTVEPDEGYRQPYFEGVHSGEAFIRWILIAAINNKN